MATNPPDAQGPQFEDDDDLVQLLTVARYALELGRTEQAAGALDEALALARRRVSRRAGHEPGDFVRRAADE